MAKAGAATSTSDEVAAVPAEGLCWFALMRAAWRLAEHDECATNRPSLSASACVEGLADALHELGTAERLCQLLDRAHVYRVVVPAMTGLVLRAQGDMYSASGALLAGASTDMSPRESLESY